MTTTTSWAVSAPFLTAADQRWITDFVEDDRHRFAKIPHVGVDVDWHSKKKAVTGVAEWRAFGRTASNALSWAEANDGGAITVFPQLAAAVALRKRIRRSDAPLVCWFFNTNLGRDVRTLVARRTLSAVDRFVVHSTVEIEAYADHLSLPTDRFVFVPVQYGGAVQSDAEDTEQPFVFATGSGFRDYGTFFEAMAIADVPAKVVAGPRVLAGLTPPPNVEILDGVDRSGIHRLVRQARVNVIPMFDEGLTGGLVTMAEAFRHGRGLVVSERSGIDDYVHHGENALLVPQRDARAMAEAIRAMWDDDELRATLSAGAAASGEAHHTDEAAAHSLVSVLDAVA